MLVSYCEISAACQAYTSDIQVSSKHYFLNAILNELTLLIFWSKYSRGCSNEEDRDSKNQKGLTYHLYWRKLLYCQKRSKMTGLRSYSPLVAERDWNPISWSPAQGFAKFKFCLESRFDGWPGNISIFSTMPLQMIQHKEFCFFFFLQHNQYGDSKILFHFLSWRQNVLGNNGGLHP